jgi:hypothetical protein
MGNVSWRPKSAQAETWVAEYYRLAVAIESGGAHDKARRG